MKLRLLRYSKKTVAVIMFLVFALTFLTFKAPIVQAAPVTTQVVSYDLPTYGVVGQSRQILTQISPNPPSGSYLGCQLSMRAPDGIPILLSSRSNATGFVSFSYTPSNVGIYNINNFLFPGQNISTDVYTSLNVSISQQWVVSTIQDITPPTGSIVIDNGAASTSTILVNLTLSANDDLSKVKSTRFSNDGTSWSSWEPYTVFTPIPVSITNKAWNLTSGNGIKTVYAQFMDEAGLLSTIYSDTITLNAGLAISSISCFLSAATLTVGGNTIVSGNLTPALSGTSIQIQGRVNGSAWSTFATVTTATNGGYSFVWSPTVNGTWEVKAIWGGDINTAPCESPLQTLIMGEAASSSSLFISLSSTNVTVGKTVTISGYLSPARAGAEILIQCRISNGAWLAVGTVFTQADGGYSFVWTPSSDGAWEVKASWGEVPALACESALLQLQVTSGVVDFSDPTTLLIIAGSITTISIVAGAAYSMSVSKQQTVQGILAKIIDGLSKKSYISLTKDFDKLIELINNAVLSGKLPSEILFEPYFTLENLKTIKETIAERLVDQTIVTIAGDTEIIPYIDGVKKVLKTFNTFKDWKEVADSKHPEEEIVKRIDEIVEPLVKIRRQREESNAKLIVTLISDSPTVKPFGNRVICKQLTLDRDFWFSWGKTEIKKVEEYEPIRLHYENGKIIGIRSRWHWLHINLKGPYLDKKNRIEIFFLPLFHTPIVREKLHATNVHKIMLYHVFVRCFGTRVVAYKVVDGVIDSYYTNPGKKDKHPPTVENYLGWYS